MILIETNKKKKTSKSKTIDQDQHKKQKINETSNGNTVQSVLDNQWTEKLRCSNKTTYLTNCHDPYSTPDSKVIVDQPGEEQNSIKAPSKPVLVKKTEPSINSDVDIPDQIPTHRHILVGPDFQASIPDWTGLTSDSDPKWLGTRMWTPKNGESKSLVGLDNCSCDCHFPNSIECFRLHIAEKRFKLKRELGVLFYQWRFDRMGEEVSLSWTRDEEGIFKDLMRLYYVNLPTKFWNNGYRLLPTKRREDLVSYYFNVFVIQRRSYQNRITPNDIDSDDDERECGVIGDSFGYKALRGLGFEPPCTLNKQHTELQ